MALSGNVIVWNWSPAVLAGAQYMTDDEAQSAGQNNMRHKHATHDLFNHIGAGKEAVWVRELEFSITLPQKHLACSANFYL